jgi:hypothetical protein
VEPEEVLMVREQEEKEETLDQVQVEVEEAPV